MYFHIISGFGQPVDNHILRGEVRGLYEAVQTWSFDVDVVEVWEFFHFTLYSCLLRVWEIFLLPPPKNNHATEV
jgi:hypothetical protein